MSMNKDLLMAFVGIIGNHSDEDIRENLELALVVRALTARQAKAEPAPAAKKETPVPSSVRAEAKAPAPEPKEEPAPAPAPATPVRPVVRHIRPEYMDKTFKKGSPTDREEFSRLMNRMYINVRSTKGKEFLKHCMNVCDKKTWPEIPAVLEAESLKRAMHEAQTGTTGDED